MFGDVNTKREITHPDALTNLRKKINVKVIPVTGRGGPLGCETPRLPNVLHNRFTDGGKVYSFTRRPPLTQEDPWYSFLLEAESTPGL
jgi:hypothetical protein